MPIVNGFAWHQCETGSETICGTWTWVEAEQHFSADWQNGAHAFLDLLENDSRVVLRRVDTSGTSTGLVADYVATSSGPRSIQGTVSWKWPGHGDASGTWNASW